MTKMLEAILQIEIVLTKRALEEGRIPQFALHGTKLGYQNEVGIFKRYDKNQKYNNN